jgi:putative membrane protein
MNLQSRIPESDMESAKTKGSKWWETGIRPDYRFSLANERTFLAWIRTSLAIVAGAIGIDQFASHLGSAQLRLVLSIALLVVGGVLGGVAYTRWARAERAMRQETDLPLSLLLPFLALFTAVLAVGLAAIIVIFG